MILDFLKPNSDQTKLNLERINNFIQNPKFLQGLGKEADSLDYSDDLLVTGSLIEGVTLFSSQEMMNQEQPWSHQYFPDQYNAAAEAVRENSSPINNQELSSLTDGKDDYLGKIESSFRELAKKHGIAEVSKELGASTETIEWALSYTFEGNLYDLLDNTLYSAYFSEFHKSPFWNRICEFFEAGGLPCGWVGGVSLEQGGDPLTSLVMCHRNTKDRPREIVFSGITDII